jgi:hypothetical protein
MTVEDITMVTGVYLTGAVIIGLLAAFRWELRLKARLPACHTYMWGFFFGCICILGCFPLAALSVVETIRAVLLGKWAAYEVHGIYAVLFALNAACGWFIIRRKGWAWVLGTFLAPICGFPVLRDLLGPVFLDVGFLGYGLWVVNCVYGRKRWFEIHHPESVTAPAAARPFEPVIPQYLPALPAWPSARTSGDASQKRRAAAELVLVD